MSMIDLTEAIIATLSDGDEPEDYLGYVLKSALVASHDDTVMWRQEVQHAGAVSYVACVQTKRKFAIDLLVRWVGDGKQYRVVTVALEPGPNDPPRLVEEIDESHPQFEMVEELHSGILHWLRRRELKFGSGR